MLVRDRFHSISMSAALAVVAVLAALVTAAPANAAPQASRLTLDAVAAKDAPRGAVELSSAGGGILTTCVLDPGTPVRRGSQVVADAKVTCGGQVFSIDLGVLLVYKGKPVGDGTQGTSGSPTSGFGLSDIENCRNGMWQSYAIGIVVFLNGTPPAIAREALGPQVNITC